MVLETSHMKSSFELSPFPYRHSFCQSHHAIRLLFPMLVKGARRRFKPSVRLSSRLRDIPAKPRLVPPLLMPLSFSMARTFRNGRNPHRSRPRNHPRQSVGPQSTPLAQKHSKQHMRSESLEKSRQQDPCRGNQNDSENAVNIRSSPVSCRPT